LRLCRRSLLLLPYCKATIGVFEEVQDDAREVPGCGGIYKKRLPCSENFPTTTWQGEGGISRSTGKIPRVAVVRHPSAQYLHAKVPNCCLAGLTQGSDHGCQERRVAEDDGGPGHACRWCMRQLIIRLVALSKSRYPDILACCLINLCRLRRRGFKPSSIIGMLGTRKFVMASHVAWSSLRWS
jgi:hypothetical protein